MIRILAGEKKGHLLRVARKEAVRPTTANARQVLFDMLASEVADTRWLDLYAGSGAVGLEALSRGASECLLVESTRRCVPITRANIARLGYKDRCRVLAARVDKALRQLADEGQTFDVIFLDPPYKGDEARKTLTALGQPPALALLHSGDSLVVAQVSSRMEIRREWGRLVLERERKLGDTRLCFYRLRRQGESAGEPEAPGAAEGGSPSPR
jgi:16S rRNA (guanine(966)-N(2))-methyltransferase RsmD